MNNKIGYYVYSIFTVLFFVVLFGFCIYLIYDLIIQLSDKDFSNNTVIQALITLFITVFAGGFFSKQLEIRYAKKLELYTIRNKISIQVIDLATAYTYNPKDEVIKYQLIAESSKIKLYFNNNALKAINEFISSENKVDLYESLINELKKSIK